MGVMVEPILVAQSKQQIFLLPKMANRHGLIAMRAASSQLGRQLVRGILGGILGGGSRRR
jgi:hypothetical protein